MLPKYPNFSRIDIGQKNEVENIVSRFEPYSDFNFVSLFSWDTNGTTQLSTLHGNLVISLPDYLTGETTFSLIGEVEVDDSLKVILDSTAIVKLVPSAVIDKIDNEHMFRISEDKDNFDYVYDLSEHSSLAGQEYKEKRRKAKRFANTYKHRFTPVDLTLTEIQGDIIKLFDRWAKNKSKTNEAIAERHALSRLLKNADVLGVEGLMLWVDRVPVGFSIYEPTPSGQSLWHFHKTLPNYKNADVFLTNIVSKELFNMGQQTINWEQDLGIEGLRKSKMSYHPKKFLKKYTVRLKE